MAVVTVNDDLISRQAVIKNLAGIAKNCAKSDKQKALIGRCIYMIDNMPTIQPEQKTGRWIDDNCSECGQYVYHGDARDFCPNCGAKMGGEDESNG